MCVRVRVRVRVCVCVWVRACVRACVCVCLRSSSSMVTRASHLTVQFVKWLHIIPVVDDTHNRHTIQKHCIPTHIYTELCIIFILIIFIEH